MRKILTFSLFWLTVYSFGQYSDNFTDGDFSSNPAWLGCVDRFIVTASKQLQLSAPAETSFAYLSTPSVAIENATWQFYMKAGLVLTSGNYVNYYLVSNNPDLSGALNGYYVMVGNTGKEVALYRQSGVSKIKLVSGVLHRLPSTGDMTELTVKVTRDASGRWSLYSRLSSESDFVLEGIVTDDTFDKSNYSGVFCRYSSANSDKYIFDDFVVSGTAVLDTVPPSIVSYRLVGKTQLVVVFSELVSLSGVTVAMPPELGRYTQALAGDSLVFTFASPIPNGRTFIATLEGVADGAGNYIPKCDLSFGYYSTAFGDLVFNEIMCDPYPVVGLPDVEYIELFNRQSFPVDLAGWKLYYGSKPYAITAGKIPSKGYLLLGTPKAVAALSCLGAGATMSNFPALSSTGQLLYLMNEKDSLIAFVNYSSDWYKDRTKAAGGWSLECRDSENLSGADENWMASSDVSGGTPGRRNASAAVGGGVVIPHVIASSFFSPDTLLVRFNKPMLQADLKNKSLYISGEKWSVKSIESDFPQGEWVKLVLSPALPSGTLWSMTIPGMRDVDKNVLRENVVFGVPDSCECNDVIINEILAHPKEDGAPFVELYNRSKKIVELKSLYLNRRKPSGELDVASPISVLGEQLFPGEYAVLTTSQNGVCNFYNCQGTCKWIEMTNFVPLSDASGNVRLENRSGVVIDSVEYDEKHHESVIQNPTGISFERVNPDWSSENPENWHSCAFDAGNATPGYQNSQFRQSPDERSGPKCFWFDQESFTPDNDGVEDLLFLRYKMPDNGYSVTVTIYDAVGRRVRCLANNAVLGAEGVLTWDGKADSDRLVPVGVYVMFVDAVLPLKGKREKAKLACVVLAK